MQLVSIPKAAKLLNLSAATIRRRLKAGMWPAYVAGSKSTRLDLDEIKALLRCPAKTSEQEQASPG